VKNTSNIYKIVTRWVKIKSFPMQEETQFCIFVNYRITVNFKIVTLNISKILRQLFLLFASSWNTEINYEQIVARCFWFKVASPTSMINAHCQPAQPQISEQTLKYKIQPWEICWKKTCAPHQHTAGKRTDPPPHIIRNIRLFVSFREFTLPKKP